MTDQVIYDRGYRTYEGERTGPAGARRAVYRDGIRRVLGLRRKAREKVFPWIMIAVAVGMAAIVIGVHWFIGDIAQSLNEGVPTYGELFDLYSWIGLLFIAFAGPWLLIPDRTRGVLSVYFSRPLTVDGYLMPPHVPAAKGQAAIQQGYETLFRGPVKITEFAISHIEATIQGDVAFSAATYTQRLLLSDGKTVSDTGKSIAILKRVQGEWKLAYVTFNSDLPSTPCSSSK